MLNVLIGLISLSYANPVVIDADSGNELMVFKSNGVTVGKLVVHKTINNKPTLRFIASDSTPIIQMGSDRSDIDVQISPTPVDKPRYHFNVTGGGLYGDMRIDGTMTIGTETGLCNNVNDPSTCLPVDPRGALRISRDRPTNEVMSSIILNRRNNSTNQVEEYFRIGVTTNGFTQFGFNSTGDQPNMIFRKGTDYVKTMMCGNNGACGTLIKDNSGALKYESPNGVTTVAP